MMLFTVVRPGKPYYTFGEIKVDGTDLTTYSFTSTAIGTAAANRLVVVAGKAVSGTTGRTLSSATIGGVSATIVIQHDLNAGQTDLTFIIAAVVPTGTTATVALTFSGGMGRCGIGSFALYRLASTTATDTASDGTDVVTLDVDTVAGSIVIAVVGDGASGVVGWSGVTINGVQTEIESGNNLSVASAQATATATPRTVNCDFTGSPSLNNGCSAVWR